MDEIKFIQSAVAFLDILGFKGFISTAEAENSKEFCRLLDAIGRQLSYIYNGSAQQNLFPADVGLKIINISDSFVLSAPINSEKHPNYSGLVAVAIKAIQLAHELLKMGFLLRGGIAVGSVYRTDTNIFGTGYQKAYETESSLANSPRVLLDKSAADLLRTTTHYGCPIDSFPIFIREGDKFMLDIFYTHWSFFGNYINHDLIGTFEIYKSKIEENLSTLPPGRSRDKWKWMAEFFNSKLKHSSDLRHLSPIDLDKFSQFVFRPAIEEEPATFEEAFGQFMSHGTTIKILSDGGAEAKGKTE
jgi:hypothetical protein